jgi:ribosomal protein S18 acetylase RimI-like enzyme
MTDIFIRPYQEPDQAAVFQIAADTAFFGEPVEAFMEDRNLFNDSFTRYYTMFEAPFSWVAEGPDGVIGFLLGCADTSLRTKRWTNQIIHYVLGGVIRGRYKIGRRTMGYALGNLAGYAMGDVPGVDLEEYPAHLHINMQAGSRGSGGGMRLMEAYLEQLRGQSVRGVQLETTNMNVAACYLYEKVGFRLLGAHVNRYWSKRLAQRVENRRYGLKLL